MFPIPAPVVKAGAASLVRYLVFWLGIHGVDVSGVAGEDIAHALDAVLNALLVLAPVAWSLLHKFLVHDKIQTAEMQARLAANGQG